MGAARMTEASPLLVSGCLAGMCCRFDGRAKTDEAVVRQVEAGTAVPVCPEMLGGLGAPRRPAEIVGGDGEDVLDGRARVLDDEGRDVTAEVVSGARRTLAVAQAAGARTAVLMDRSPSCGTATVYDGTFRGVRRSGLGVTTALLRRNGVEVVSGHDVAGVGESGPGAAPTRRTGPRETGSLEPQG